MRVLILGGTAEARDLAGELTARGHEVTTSLAGRTREPVPPVGAVRSGGFGGPAGLARYLEETGTELLIDATHPFAGTISANAAEAGRRTGARRIALSRPPWPQREGDRWERVRSLDEAASRLPAGSTVLLALGRQHLAPFGRRPDVRFVVRAIEPFTPPFPCDVILQRPSAEPEAEAALLRDLAVECIVSRNSGGSGAYAKIAAARALSLPVVMIDRPPGPPPPTYDNVDDLLGAL